MDQFTLLFQGQYPAVISQGVNNDGGILTRLDYLIQIDDGSVAGSDGQGSILPLGALGGEQEAAYQVRCGHVLVAGHGDQGLA